MPGKHEFPQTCRLNMNGDDLESKWECVLDFYVTDRISGSVAMYGDSKLNGGGARSFQVRRRIRKMKRTKRRKKKRTGAQLRPGMSSVTNHILPMIYKRNSACVRLSRKLCTPLPTSVRLRLPFFSTLRQISWQLPPRIVC
jgi:hypothetical protein